MVDEMEEKDGGGFSEPPSGIAVQDEEGRVVLQVGLLVTLYFEKGYTQQVREAVAACFEEYRNMCGPNLRWAHPSSRGFQDLRKRPVPDRDPAQWLRDPSHQQEIEEQGWEFTWHGGRKKEEASHFWIRALGLPNDGQGYLDHLSAALPLDWYASHPGRFPDLVLGWCERIQPLHGYGGIGLATSAKQGISYEHGAAAYGLARRFPGLELDDPLSHALMLRGGRTIKGGNWLTVLNDALIAELGGLKNLAGQLGEGFVLHPYVGGVMIQVGSQPQLGDVNRQLEPAGYRHLARVLKPVRARAPWPFHSYGINKEKAASWFSRFDSDDR